MFLGTAICFFFFGSLVIVVACYRAYNKRLQLHLNHDCIANASLHCYSAFELWELSDFLPCLQQCIDCVLNLPLDDRLCLVQAKQVMTN